VKDFKEKITYSCEIFNQIISSIFTDKINTKLFHKTCQEKLKTLKKNNMFMILSCIIGFKNKKTDSSIIEKSLEKCLLYHFMVNEIKDKNTREYFKNFDSITYKPGGGFVEDATKKLLLNPENISSKLTKVLFNELLTQLCNDENNPYERKLDNGKNKNDKRRTLNFFQKTLMFYYYKQKIPSIRLETEFSIELICPNSSDWLGELDKDRTGNLIPIISSMNSSRGNKHINKYRKTEIGNTFCDFIKDIIPELDVYDKIVSHNKKPTIVSTVLYNEMCEKNEEIYKKNFIDCLFKS
jgi:hypothetical protein